MKNNKLSELSLTELNKQKKQLSGLLIGSAILMLFLFGALLYLIVKKQNFVLLSVIPGCMLAWLPVAIKLSQLNAEIKLRGSETNSGL
ncbi:hypothetical protein SRABI27_03477 [Pedobacter sp. Bi27]|uniref:hypothetical protein n=1 Tax=unclassified Pedobacter TaxID=2628915 RepID=UPI001D5085CB|nr:MULTISPECIES: hypothetical protein [unclassified Pedobacter]CAH0156860.1 hypothetical protein SRABI36_00935 [Pedobacter sp. Bi36]CAH0213187.1 hypothetical protein SRABI126_02027 [Pedobacter sp. Bi126]CAH0270434.1 hypothetical protein SRABI27_03477 [Pedobacter sp. Bi27]